MAISASEHVILDGPRNAIVRFIGIADDTTQETNVVKVDVSELSPVPDTVKVRKIDYSVQGGSVSLLWDADTPEAFAHLSGEGTEDYCRFDGLVNDADVSRSGDILLSTKGFGLNSSYTVTVELRKKYA